VCVCACVGAGGEEALLRGVRVVRGRVMGGVVGDRGTGTRVLLRPFKNTVRTRGGEGAEQGSERDTASSALFPRPPECVRALRLGAEVVHNDLPTEQTPLPRRHRRARTHRR
jgi:hypothetical protein